jgi:1,6-anhydro-N-acetylmuramate kinase
MALYLGLISGTSMDAIDAALVDIDGSRCMLTHALSRPYPDDLRTQLFKLINEPERCHLDEVGRLDTEIGEAFAATALDLLQEAKVAVARVKAIGSHGQTLRHQPHGEHPFTWQVGNPHLIAERTGITTWPISGAGTSRLAARVRRSCPPSTRRCWPVPRRTARSSTSAASPISPGCRARALWWVSIRVQATA